MTDHDALAAELRALGRAAAVPAPDERLAAAVRRRVTAPRRRYRARPLAVVAVVLLLGLFGVPPVRAAVLDWFRFAGAVVHLVPGSSATTAPPPPPGTGPPTPRAFRDLPFQPLRLPPLGEPDGVEVSADHRRLSQTWDTPDGRIRLDQFDGQLDYAFAKRAPDLQWVTVGGGSALWFEHPHELALLNPDGSERAGTQRLAGRTLVWVRPDSVLRLEGPPDRAAALALASGALPAR